MSSSSKSSYIRNKFHSKNLGPLEYLFYSVLNTSVIIDRGTSAAVIARGLVKLSNKLESNKSSNRYINGWKKSGENIIVLEGYNHRHIKYLQKEAKLVAVDTHVLYQPWSYGETIIVLTVFGQKQDLEDVFEGLRLLR